MSQFMVNSIEPQEQVFGTGSEVTNSDPLFHILSRICNFVLWISTVQQLFMFILSNYLTKPCIIRRTFKGERILRSLTVTTVNKLLSQDLVYSVILSHSRFMEAHESEKKPSKFSAVPWATGT